MKSEHSTTPGSVSELYPNPWLKPDDLHGRAVTVKIIAVNVDSFFIPQSGEKKAAAVIAFEGKGKRLIANKSQCRALAEITGSEHFADWIGHSVTLAPAQAPNGKATIAIRRAPGNGAHAPSQEDAPAAAGTGKEAQP